MSKSLKDMNQKELYQEATKLKISGRSKLKKKEFRDDLIKKIIEARKQKVEEGEEEMKVDEEGREVLPGKRMEMERENRILEEALDELEGEKTRERMIEESLDQIEADERSQRRDDRIENASERLNRMMREQQAPPEFEQQRRQINTLLTPENINKLKTFFNADNVNKIKKIYNDASKDVEKYGVRDGLIRFGMKAAYPELSLLQQATDFLGAGYSNEDHEDLMKVIRGGKSGRTGGEDFKLGMKLVVNPVEWGRLAYEEAFAVGENAISGISDVVRKVRGIKKDVSDPEADKARKVIGERKAALKKKIAQEKKLAEIKGEKYSGLSEDDIVEDKLRMPKLSDFGGQDEKGALETLGETAAETFLFVPKRFFGDEEEVMKERFRKSNPEDYRRYEQEKRDYETKKARILDTRGENIKGNAVRLRNDLADVIDAALEEERLNIKNGKQSINDSDLEELYDMSLTLKDRANPITYDNLADVYAGIKTSLPDRVLNSQKVKSRMGAFDYLENQMLKPKTDTEADLRVSTNDKFQKTMEKKQQYDKEKKILEDAIEEKRIDDERLEVIESRADQITTGYVNTDSYGRPELKPRIVYGNTDGQLNPGMNAVRTAQLFRESSLMWPQLSTEDNRRNNVLYQKNLENERMRYSKTFAVPNPNPFQRSVQKQIGYVNKKQEEEDLLIPSAYIKFAQRKLIPVYNLDKEEMKMLRDPEQVQSPFTRTEPATDFTVNMRKTQRSMRNTFPERVLRNYKGPVITPTKRPNVLENLRFTNRI
jgi:hypothetical protein